MKSNKLTGFNHERKSKPQALNQQTKDVLAETDNYVQE